MRGGKELVLATKPYAVDHAIRSWWSIFSTAFLLIAALVGTLWHFPLAGKIICSVLAGPSVSKNVRDLPRSTASSDLAQISFSGCLDGDLWNPCPKPH